MNVLTATIGVPSNVKHLLEKNQTVLQEQNLGMLG